MNVKKKKRKHFNSEGKKERNHKRSFVVLKLRLCDLQAELDACSKTTSA
jgi:hypothetical protein